MTTLDTIAQRRLGGRAQISADQHLDYVHRKLIFGQPVLKNRMYQALLEGDIGKKETAAFLSEYFHGSTQGFLKKVMPAAARAFQDEGWREYIANIVYEESVPRCHRLLFKEFLRSAKIELQAAGQAASEFTDANRRGYTSPSLAYACGYALAVEVEADYQIYLVAKFVERTMGEAIVASNEWFTVHLSESGEVEHAKQTVELADRVVRTDADYAALVEGFEQACADTEAFMNKIYNYIHAATTGSLIREQA